MNKWKFYCFNLFHYSFCFSAWNCEWERKKKMLKITKRFYLK